MSMAFKTNGKGFKVIKTGNYGGNPQAREDADGIDAQRRAMHLRLLKDFSEAELAELRGKIGDYRATGAGLPPRYDGGTAHLE
jgi:hypothetical protein